MAQTSPHQFFSQSQRGSGIRRGLNRNVCLESLGGAGRGGDAPRPPRNRAASRTSARSLRRRPYPSPSVVGPCPGRLGQRPLEVTGLLSSGTAGEAQFSVSNSRERDTAATQTHARPLRCLRPADRKGPSSQVPRPRGRLPRRGPLPGGRQTPPPATGPGGSAAGSPRLRSLPSVPRPPRPPSSLSPPLLPPSRRSRACAARGAGAGEPLA